MSQMKMISRDDADYERVVFAEVLIPGVPNTWDDIWTPSAIREAAYMFLRDGFGIDVNHDEVDRSGSVYLVESFIVREGDPDFIKDAWVVAMKIEDDDLWQDVLDNKLNGYSYQALVEFLAGVLKLDDAERHVTGTTQQATDGHTHVFMVVVNPQGEVVSGGTDEVDGHSHKITTHTLTGKAAGHTHRYNVVQGQDKS